MRHEIKNYNDIWNVEDPGPTKFTGTINDGECIALDFLDTALGRFLILLVSLVFITTYPIDNKLSHAHHKLTKFLLYFRLPV